MYFFQSQLEQLYVWQADFMHHLNNNWGFWAFHIIFGKKRHYILMQYIKKHKKKLSTQMLGNVRHWTRTLERVHWAENSAWEKKGWDCLLLDFTTFANATAGARAKKESSSPSVLSLICPCPFLFNLFHTLGFIKQYLDFFTTYLLYYYYLLFTLLLFTYF